MIEIFNDNDNEYIDFVTLNVTESLINGMEDIIMNQFTEFGKYGGTYSNTLINTKINCIIKSKMNKATTTRIFNYLFKTIRTSIINENGKCMNAYKIIGIK